MFERGEQAIESEVDSSPLPTGGRDSSKIKKEQVEPASDGGEVENVGVMKTNEPAMGLMDHCLYGFASL